MVRGHVLEVSPAAFDEIRDKFEAAGFYWLIDESLPNELWIGDFALVRAESSTEAEERHRHVV